MEERHFALLVGLRVSNPGLALNRSGQELGPTQPSLRSLTAIKIRFFELPHLLGAGCPIITSVMDCSPSGFPGFPANRTCSTVDSPIPGASSSTDAPPASAPSRPSQSSVHAAWRGERTGCATPADCAP